MVNTKLRKYMYNMLTFEIECISLIKIWKLNKYSKTFHYIFLNQQIVSICIRVLMRG